MLTQHVLISSHLSLYSYTPGLSENYISLFSFPRLVFKALPLPCSLARKTKTTPKPTKKRNKEKTKKKKKSKKEARCTSDHRMGMAGMLALRLRKGSGYSFEKVFLSLALQVLITVAVASIVVFVSSVANFFVSIPDCLVLCIGTLVLPVTVLYHLHIFYQSCQINLFSLCVFAMAMGFAVGLTCAFTKRIQFLGVTYDYAWEMIFDSVILTSAVVVSLTVYTFWVKKHIAISGVLEAQFFLAGVITLVVIFLIQTFFPLGKILIIICGGLAFLIFCGYKIYGLT